ncbi:MAG TPA: hypothetical protein VHB20_12515 [Verrucomicrobiae bacterium]|nr:hypothetical protein [Verrucomicrobiae bacterium]
MKAASANGIIQLRRVLAERFPQVPAWTEGVAARVHPCWPTGFKRLDESLQGGLPTGAISEIVCDGGGAVFLRSLLGQAQQRRQLMGLIDGCDGFDPAGMSAAALSRLLWVRCHNAEEAAKAADLLLRDRNLPLVALDLQMNPNGQLRKISATTWYRLQRIAQQSGTVLVTLTAAAMIPCAEVRVNLENRFTLADLDKEPEDIARELKFAVTRSHVSRETATAIAEAG